ncbi:uncharacterized protein LOC128166137 isoform X2 [Crassostrea angulata]|uniref:uncharacterized protein LOC128166137 isoform X2 n=1 Tax=Magallana angulata TaxID=2784310 RepID=UPI0022B0F43A|nr:uncharacterized protein LOC128166137 isoform X2 [Crassostrea angulata]
MKSLWIHMSVILLSVKCVASQCIGSEPCDCHCECCSIFCIGFQARYCTSCAKGWSGTRSNSCQRRNVAYNAAVRSSSTNTNYYARNAVDEETGTYALTKQEKNPQLTISLANMFNIKHLFVKVYAYQTSSFQVFVTNSTSNVLSDNDKCVEFPVDAKDYFDDSVSCNRNIIGDTIVVRKVSTSDILLNVAKVPMEINVNMSARTV